MSKNRGCFFFFNATAIKINRMNDFVDCVTCDLLKTSVKFNTSPQTILNNAIINFIAKQNISKNVNCFFAHRHRDREKEREEKTM